MSHTPGPWRIWEGYSNFPYTIVQGPQDGTVVIADIGFEDSEANARLIASAPELLEALKALTGNIGVFSPTHSVLRVKQEQINAALAIIAKAEGREP